MPPPTVRVFVASCGGPAALFRQPGSLYRAVAAARSVVRPPVRLPQPPGRSREDPVLGPYGLPLVQAVGGRSVCPAVPAVWRSAPPVWFFCWGIDLAGTRRNGYDSSEVATEIPSLSSMIYSGSRMGWAKLPTRSPNAAPNLIRRASLSALQERASDRPVVSQLEALSVGFSVAARKSWIPVSWLSIWELGCTYPRAPGAAGAAAAPPQRDRDRAPRHGSRSSPPARTSASA